MDPTQLDLFADYRPAAAPAASRKAPQDLSDAELIAALPDALLAEACALAAEAGRRRLGEAVGALVGLCRQFVGFGADTRVPEQIAALEALGAIGGAEACRAVSQMIVKGFVQGPNLVAAVIAASRLGVKLAPEAALPLLGNADPEIRAAACRCVRASGEIATALIERLTDRDEEVSTAAACALGAAGRGEALKTLKRRLNERPSPRVIEALAAVADEEVIVFFVRLARKRPDLAAAVLSALDEIELPRAAVVVSRLRSWLAESGRPASS